MEDRIYYRGRKAVETYKDEYAPQHPNNTYEITDCPKCGLIVCKIRDMRANRTWYIDTIEKQPDGVGSIAYCVLDKDGWERKDRRIGYPTVFLGEDAEVKGEQQLCTCDYDTVIRTIGCQCGGR